jgi:hypothetical protein
MADEHPQSQHSTFHGWKVEARITGSRPRQIGEDIFDGAWRTVNFVRARAPVAGVPNPSINVYALDTCGLYGYEAAQALRWWFHAAEPYASGLETRLVSYKVKSSIEWARDGEHETVGERPGLQVGKS